MLEGSRWDAFVPRSDDIVISTGYKAGTTWAQTIVANLLFPDGDMPAPVLHMSPWLEVRRDPVDEVIASLEAQQHRRFVKTHLPLDGLPFYDTINYIVLGRDPRDVFMSLVNHHSNYTEELRDRITGYNEQIGRAFPFELSGADAMWPLWITKGWFEWESDGYPYWSYFNHARTWWEWRHLPNILMLHFADLLADPESQIRRIANFIEVDIEPRQLPGILERTSFGYMREHFDSIMPHAKVTWAEGGRTFMHRGINGRWREVLTAEDLAMYERTASHSLAPDLRTWLERG